MNAPVSTGHKAAFIGLAAFTLASPIIAGIAVYHWDARRVSLLSFAAMFVLLIWSLVIFRRARAFGVIGFIALVVTFWLLIMVPGYVTAGKQAMRPNKSLQRIRRERRGCNPCVPCAGSLSFCRSTVKGAR